MDNIKIGCFIAECRKEKKITQQQLAAKLNITNKAVSKWETGNGVPDISLLTELAGLLDVSVDEILKAQKNEIAVSNIDDIGVTTMAEKATNNKADVIIHYMVQKSIVKFKIMSILSIAVSIVGIVIQYLIWRETKDLAGWLFGLWLEICSGGIFYYYRTLTKNQIKEYNLVTENKLDIKHISNRYSKYLFMMWTLMMLTLICYLFL